MNDQDLKPNLRVLIVDDNPSIHEDFREILCPDTAADAVLNEMEKTLFDGERPALTQTCFELSSAYQGQEALELVKQARARQQPYALAFVDVRMPPGWDGIETIARIWEADPDLQVVVCTAYADYSWEEMRAKVGQPDSLLVLKKPFDNIEVRQLAHALARKWVLTFQTRLQMAELALSEERFAKAFHESPVPSGIQHLPSLRFIDVNQRLAAVTGYQCQEMIGRTPDELFLWDQPGLANEWYDALQRQELVRDCPAKLRQRRGALREMRVSVTSIILGDQPHALLLAQDVSERATLERQLRQAQKMEAIGQLAAGVAHDFNNILTVIQGHAGLLQYRASSAELQAKSAREISNAASRAATLIRQLLMFSRKQVMQFRYLDLNALLRDILDMLKRLVGEHVEILFHPDSTLGAIHADPSMLEQIVMNLAVNARDAMPNGGRISISTAVHSLDRQPTPMDPEPRKGQFVCLEFSDTGIGMDTQVLSRVFEPFFTTKPVGKGTGLGLSTVFGIVRQHHGWVEVESKPQQGTTFKVFLPQSDEPIERRAAVQETSLQRGRETVLVAEDEEPLREMVVQVLQGQGYTVLEAASGQEALELWKKAETPIDLLLTDMVMPGGILGGELAERLVRERPDLKVIFTSGYTPGMAGKDISLLQGRNFLPKPYSIGKLAQKVRECLDAPTNDLHESSANHTPRNLPQGAQVFQP